MRKKTKLILSIIVYSLILLLTGCSTGGKNYTEKEIRSYLNQVYGKDRYSILNKIHEDEQSDVYEISYDDITFTVKSYVKDNKKQLEDKYCVEKSEKYFHEHDYTQLIAKYLDKNINIKFYSPTEPCGIIIGNITIDKNTDLNDLADLIVQIDSDLALKYKEEKSTKYDFTNFPGSIAIAKNQTVGISEYDLWEKNTTFQFSYSEETRLTKQDVLAQLEKDLGYN